MSRTSTEHDYKGEKQEANNGDDFDTGKDELGFSVNSDGEYV